jgi:hypothetical protein
MIQIPPLAPGQLHPDEELFISLLPSLVERTWLASTALKQSLPLLPRLLQVRLRLAGISTPDGKDTLAMARCRLVSRGYYCLTLRALNSQLCTACHLSPRCLKVRRSGRCFCK